MEIRDFITLFEGNEQAYGGEEGLCIKQPVYSRVWRGHLYGSTPIGIYPLRATREGATLCKWTCSDIDVDDYRLADNLANTLHKMGMNPWVERSRSKGWHVWVFFTDWVWAKHARHMMLLAHQVAQIEAKEVNPKQISLVTTKGYGNYVRLPYPHGATERQVMWNEGEPISLDSFLPAAINLRVGPSAVEAWSARYTPPERLYSTGQWQPRVEQPTMSPKTKIVLEMGPGDGYDRSGTLLRLANLLRDDGFGSEVMYHLVSAADLLWGKFGDRHDREERIREIVGKACEQG